MSEGTSFSEDGLSIVSYDSYSISDVFDALTSFQINFNGFACQSIFGTVERDHYWNKWIQCSSNALIFWNNLDINNRNLVLKYIKGRWL